MSKTKLKKNNKNAKKEEFLEELQKEIDARTKSFSIKVEKANKEMQKILDHIVVDVLKWNRKETRVSAQVGIGKKGELHIASIELVNLGNCPCNKSKKTLKKTKKTK